MARNNEYGAPQEIEKIDIMGSIDNMYRAFRKYWKRYLLIVIAMTFAVTGGAMLSNKPYYEAYTSFAVSAKTAEFYNSSGYYNQQVTTEMGQVLTYVLDSDVLKQMVAEDMGMDSVPGKITAKALKDTNLITLTVTESDPQLAYDILQCVIEDYPKVSRHVIGDVSLEEMDSSGVPTKPANTRSYVKTGIKGMLLGMLICLALMYLYALTRKTIHTEEDLKNILNVPSLGAIPTSRFKERRSLARGDFLLLMDHKGVPPTFQEAMRNVRTRVVRSARKHNAKTILITSSIPGEGKSTISSNIAIALFRQGYKVILVDGDLRNPSLTTTMGMPLPEFGFRDVLEGRASVEEALVPYVRSDSNNQREHSHLQVIYGERPLKATTSLINSERTQEVLDELAGMADFVILDTPPSAILSDAAAYGQYVDGAIFVVRQDEASEQTIHEGMEMLASSGVQLLGCVLNNATALITSTHSNYKYKKYGYYGYGYGNRYGDERASGKSGDVYSRPENYYYANSHIANDRYEDDEEYLGLDGNQVEAREDLDLQDTNAMADEAWED